MYCYCQEGIISLCKLQNYSKSSRYTLSCKQNLCESVFPCSKSLTLQKNCNSQKKMKTTALTLQQAQEQVDEWIRTYGVRYFSELTNMAILTEEVGELARIMARKYGEQSFKEGEPHDPADEMADVLWVLLCLANQTGVDLTEAFRKNLEKKTARDKERHRNNPKLHP